LTGRSVLEYSGLGNENGIMMRHRIEAGTSCHGGFGTSLAEDLLRTGLRFDVLENFELRAVIKERMKQKRDSIRKRKREVPGARRHPAEAAPVLTAGDPTQTIRHPWHKLNCPSHLFLKRKLTRIRQSLKPVKFVLVEELHAIHELDRENARPWVAHEAQITQLRAPCVVLRAINPLATNPVATRAHGRDLAISLAVNDRDVLLLLLETSADDDVVRPLANIVLWKDKIGFDEEKWPRRTGV
jgi:hypothetical protein